MTGEQESTRMRRPGLKSSLAVLLTCHNRREQTLLCLERLREQQDYPAEATVVLVDDGSQDGTAEEVRERFPEVVILRGDGSLFWNRGMHHAFAHALERGFDAYLWLNDDTMLLPDALQKMLAVAAEQKARGEAGIVVGSTADETTGLRSYGGFHWGGGWRRTLLPVVPDPLRALRCETMNGNCTLIPHAVAARIGNLDPAYSHSFGDLDYGFRARRAGFGIVLVPGFVGTCSDNPPTGTWRDTDASFARRWKHLNSVKGSPFREWAHYARRHLGVLWPLYAVSPYLKTLASGLQRPRVEAGQR